MCGLEDRGVSTGSEQHRVDPPSCLDISRTPVAVSASCRVRLPPSSASLMSSVTEMCSLCWDGPAWPKMDLDDGRSRTCSASSLAPAHSSVHLCASREPDADADADSALRRSHSDSWPCFSRCEWMKHGDLGEEA